MDIERKSPPGKRRLIMGERIVLLPEKLVKSLNKCCTCRIYHNDQMGELRVLQCPHVNKLARPYHTKQLHETVSFPCGRIIENNNNYCVITF